MRLGERRDHVQIERLADRAGLLGAVQHANGAHRRRQRRQQRRSGKWPVQPHLYHADPLAAFDQRAYGLIDGLGSGAHQHKYALGLWMS